MLRVVGLLLVVGGLALAVYGGLGVARSFDSMAGDFGNFLMLGGGLLLTVIGLGLTNMGFLGAQAGYVARESAPAVRETGAAFRGDGDRTGEVGRTGERAGSGFCPACGRRRQAGARFCGECGKALD